MTTCDSILMSMTAVSGVYLSRENASKTITSFQIYIPANQLLTLPIVELRYAQFPEVST